ncbi:hypothetical protein V5O48_010342, partial [Marasmius crinis-equi]
DMDSAPESERGRGLHCAAGDLIGQEAEFQRLKQGLLEVFAHLSNERNAAMARVRLLEARVKETEAACKIMQLCQADHVKKMNDRYQRLTDLEFRVHQMAHSIDGAHLALLTEIYNEMDRFD